MVIQLEFLQLSTNQTTTESSEEGTFLLGDGEEEEVRRLEARLLDDLRNGAESSSTTNSAPLYTSLQAVQPRRNKRRAMSPLRQEDHSYNGRGLTREELEMIQAAARTGVQGEKAINVRHVNLHQFRTPHQVLTIKFPLSSSSS